jgi:8-oxo-dGTP pyrophosphatase MutT (NUDIX family)
MQLYAGVLLITNDQSLILQKRDNKPGVVNRGKIAIFGGSANGGESVEDCAIREIFEEVGLSITTDDLALIGVYHSTVTGVGEVESHVYYTEQVDMRLLTLHEGEQFFILARDELWDIDHLPLTPICRLALTDFYRKEVTARTSMR